MPLSAHHMVLNWVSTKDNIAAAKVAATGSRFASIIRSNAWREMCCDTSWGLENQMPATTEGDRRFWRQTEKSP